MKIYKLGLLLTLFFIFFLTGCEKNYDDKLRSLKSSVAKNKTGNPDFWLAKKLFNGEWSEVVLFFGFVDNYENCEELKEYYKKIDPVIAFRCIKAN